MHVTPTITFREEPRHEAYGYVMQFVDYYGNRWDLQKWC